MVSASSYIAMVSDQAKSPSGLQQVGTWMKDDVCRFYFSLWFRVGGRSCSNCIASTLCFHISRVTAAVGLAECPRLAAPGGGLPSGPGRALLLERQQPGFWVRLSCNDPECPTSLNSSIYLE